ncbi:metallophosphatase family protein [Aquabacterium sp. A7-Y]|uniref:metallophosphoesterase family protein n=1 Tax=Aquabacterium sp. A7-Y TaxID=1349605 RepID=UPI00223DEE40|nr:metallophosphoesterase family protein [Aquabacterium sp. A7-Y]MCW7540030.1 metallophosphatase family protein [Aquabacterium sp. A7-Y]
MRLAIVSDIHGNLPALDAVLADIQAAGADATLNLGDIASGPLWPCETLDRLMPLALPTIRGNHERQVLRPLEGMGLSDRHAAERLTPPQREWLAGLPAQLRWREEVYACHGTPGSDLQYFMETVCPDFGGRGWPGVRAASHAEVLTRAGAAQAAVILCGHTHKPRVMQLEDGRLVVNPGSVGLQAYDDSHPHEHVMENGSPHARYALIEKGAAGWSVQLRAVPYDWEAAARQAERHGRGDWADALRTGRVGRREGDIAAALRASTTDKAAPGPTIAP